MFSFHDFCNILYVGDFLTVTSNHNFWRHDCLKKMFGPEWALQQSATKQEMRNGGRAFSGDGAAERPCLTPARGAWRPLPAARSSPGLLWTPAAGLWPPPASALPCLASSRQRPAWWFFKSGIKKDLLTELRNFLVQWAFFTSLLVHVYKNMTTTCLGKNAYVNKT